MSAVEQIDKLWKKLTGDHIINNFIHIILVYGNEEWIKWLIKNGYNMLYKLNKDNYKKVLDVYKMEGYKLIDLLLNKNNWTYESLRQMNLVVKDINKEEMKELINVYKENKGHKSFNKWFENLILNQV